MIQQYRKKTLGLLHSLLNFQNSLAREVQVITDYKPLVSISKKDIATCSERSQCILQKIHQYRIYIKNKLGTDLYITDWQLRQNDAENRDEEIAGLHLSINATDLATEMPTCMRVLQN